MHTSSYGMTISTNLAKTAAGTLGANFGTSDSYNSSLNNAYIRGATDLMHSQVKNQGCLMMNIDNDGASYEYIPGHEMHESSSFAIGLSGLDLSSPNAFAYSLGRSLASSAASAGVGILASKAGLGGFVSTIAASLAGSYVAGSGIKEVSSVAFERSGQGFQAVNIGFDKSEFDTVVNKIKENIFNEALNAGAPIQEVEAVVQQEIEKVTKDVVEFQQNAKSVQKLAKEAKAETTVKQTRDAATENALLDLILNTSADEPSILEQQIADCFNQVMYEIPEITPQDQMSAFSPKNKAEAALKEATLLRYKLEDFVARHPEAAELCSKMFIGAVYALQGVEYAIAGAVAGPIGVATKFATQESAAYAIDTGIDEASNQAAQLITESETLQQEFASTIKFCTYAGLCAGSVKAGKRLVSSLSKSVAENATTESILINLSKKEGIGAYKYVGGHHPLQQAAFRDHPNYSAADALAVSEKWLSKFGNGRDIHIAITNAQRVLQKELLSSGRPNTMAEQIRISWQSMIDAGIPEIDARKITARAFWDLRRQGVKQPTNIPWSKK